MSAPWRRESATVTETELSCLCTLDKKHAEAAALLLANLRMKYGYEGVGQVVRQSAVELLAKDVVKNIPEGLRDGALSLLYRAGFICSKPARNWG